MTLLLGPRPLVCPAVHVHGPSWSSVACLLSRTTFQSVATVTVQVKAVLNHTPRLGRGPVAARTGVHPRIHKRTREHTNVIIIVVVVVVVVVS